MRKIRSSTKIFVGFILLSIGGVYGFNKVQDILIMNDRFAPIEPGKVNIVGINTGAGYLVIVANQIAQLVQGQANFGANDSSEGGADEGAIKKRIPIKELLGTLQGDPVSLGSFVMIMDDLKENDLPSVRVTWTKDQLQKALNGDAALQAKLEHDLNLKLDGTPLSRLSLDALGNGIVIQSPVTVTVNIEGKPRDVVGQVLEGFKTGLAKTVESDYADKSNVTKEMIAGYYRLEAKNILSNARRKENVRKELADAISTSLSKARVVTPEKILKSAFIVLNDSFITDASYKGRDTSDGKKLFDLTIDLNDEGRRRLWQFSKDRVGDQLLLVSGGIAIAAPRIQHPLAQGEITISNMPDESLITDLITTIKTSKQGIQKR